MSKVRYFIYIAIIGDTVLLMTVQSSPVYDNLFEKFALCRDYVTRLAGFLTVEKLTVLMYGMYMNQISESKRWFAVDNGVRASPIYKFLVVVPNDGVLLLMVLEHHRTIYILVCVGLVNMNVDVSVCLEGHRSDVPKLDKSKCWRFLSQVDRYGGSVR